MLDDATQAFDKCLLVRKQMIDTHTLTVHTYTREMSRVTAQRVLHCNNSVNAVFAQHMHAMCVHLPRFEKKAC